MVASGLDDYLEKSKLLGAISYLVTRLLKNTLENNALWKARGSEAAYMPISSLQVFHKIGVLSL